MKYLPAILGLALIPSCERKSPTPSGTANDEQLRVFYAQQTLTWYNSMAALRKETPTKELVDEIIVSNYFAPFLMERKLGMDHGKLVFAAAAFKTLGRDHVESKVWSLRREGWENFRSVLMESHGFDPSELQSFDDFLAARNDYFDALEAFNAPGNRED